jgi:hypothetical protein
MSLIVRPSLPKTPKGDEIDSDDVCPWLWNESDRRSTAAKNMVVCTAARGEETNTNKFILSGNLKLKYA